MIKQLLLRLSLPEWSSGLLHTHKEDSANPIWGHWRTRNKRAQGFVVSGNALETPRPLQRLFKLHNGAHGRNFKRGAGTLRTLEAMIAR
jgi:hypothetical protein